MKHLISKLNVRTTGILKEVRILSVANPFIDDRLVASWQKWLDLIAKLTDIPAALIMKLNQDTIEVFMSSNTASNPYHAGEKDTLGRGLYCESVIGTQESIHVSDATKSEIWKDNNPDVEMNMISYLGYPVNWPDGEPFGTICVLDRKEIVPTPQLEESMTILKESIESDLALIQTRKNLLFEQERFKVVFETAQMGISIMDALGVTVMRNRWWEQHLNFTEDELKNLSLLDIIHPEDREDCRNKLASITMGEFSVFRKSVRLTKKDSGYLSTDLTAESVPDDEGNTAMIVCMVDDLTEKIIAEEKLKASESRYRFLTENTSDVIWLLDVETKKFTYLSPSVQKLRGYTVEEVLDQPMEEVMTPESLERVTEALIKGVQNFLVTGISNPSYVRVDQPVKGGGIVHTEVTTSLHYTREGKLEVIGVSRDISQRLEAERQIKQKNDELTKLLSERDKLFSIIAHDLRSPFQGLLGFSEILSNAIKESDFETVSDVGGKFQPMIRRVYNLIENLLQWVAIQKKEFRFVQEKIRLREIAESVINLNEINTSEKQLNITNRIPPHLTVLADLQMINTVMRNLYSNAIKFTPTGGEITLEALKEGPLVEISIRDTGIGMPDHLASNLFMMDKNTKRKGTAGESSSGLGLILVKDYVEKNGGTLRFITSEGKGTTFSFTLPAER